MKRETALTVAIVLLLVAIGVAGRWCQVQWNVTPTAAVALFAGYFFRRSLAAYVVPLSIMALSNLLLESYSHWIEMVAVYGAFLLPVAFSSLLGKQWSVSRLCSCVLLQSVAFFLITNLAVWIVRRGTVYDNSFAGLMDCYYAGLLFFRWMLAGDFAFTAITFGSYAAVRQLALSTSQSSKSGAPTLLDRIIARLLGTPLPAPVPVSKSTSRK
ncbi:MAG: DUF6580 family putative transport protein [Planctomycetota bacterium]|nr:DUF6580 family putative transport protein [Planctomycetota bacterium]